MRTEHALLVKSAPFGADLSFFNAHFFSGVGIRVMGSLETSVGSAHVGAQHSVNRAVNHDFRQIDKKRKQ